MKYAQIMPFILLLSSCIFAAQLSVTVTATQDTLLSMTNVSVISNGIILSTQKTGEDGIARFNLADGSYFVLLPRTSIYPPYVALVDVKGDTNVKLTKYLCGSACTAHAYGQITGPLSFENTSVTAYSNGLLVKRALPNSAGLYALSYIPEGNYELVFESPGFEASRFQAFLPASDFVEMNAQLGKVPVPKEQKVEISVSPRVQQYSMIEISLSNGTPMAGKEITIQTPSGTVRAMTGIDGKMRINAAEPGTYIFNYPDGNLSASTNVVGKETPAKNNTPAVPNGAEFPPFQQIPPANVAQPNIGFFAAGLAIIIALSSFALAAAVFLAWKLTRKKHGDAGPGRPHKHSHKKN